MPKEMFRQVILNSSGFGNYVIPTFGILLIDTSNKPNIEKNNTFGFFNAVLILS